ncbi:MAG: pimeloyl-ACP methyl ester carboxylesterase [Acidimicrobiales bacterium]|jgi:pimeloyl-ACP methyl ester carboxylesterase
MSYPPAAELRQRAIVLVHGAWVGEWSWLPVMADLLASGRPVHNISLTGHGAKRHLSGPHVTLADHVADVVGVIDTLDLTEVTLVGHSYGGRVITQAWEQLSDRVSGLVYLDAHAPVAETPPQPANRSVEGGMVPFQLYDPAPEIIGSDEGARWFYDRVMPQSAACLSADWQVSLPDELPKTFIFATADKPSRFQQYADVCAASSTWDYHELDGPHFLMFSHPKEVAQLILGR